MFNKALLMTKSNINFLEPSQQQLNSLLEYYQAGRYVDAEKLSLSITQEFPKHQFAWKVLGTALKQMGKLNESLVALQKSVELNPQDAEAHNNLGITLQELGRLDEAEASYRKAIELKPDLAEAYNNLGNTLKEQGRLDEAEVSLRQAIALKPDYAEAYNNLGVMLQELGKLDEAEASYRQAIELKPDFAKAYNNLGNTLKEQGRLDEAEVSLRQAIELKPDLAEAYNNLGNTLKVQSRLDEAEVSLRKAIALKPDLTEAWNNIFFLLQAISLQSSSLKDRIPLFDEQTNSKYPQILKSILSYRLNQGSPSTDKSFKEVLNILSSADNTFIKNPKVSSNKLIKPTLPEKITALVHFGRSGTGLMHSLIDGHPEVSTLPSIYFSEFFDHFTWKKIIVDGWEEMADRFATIYDILFDASSNIKIPSKGNRYISNIGQKEGMTNIGTEKNEVLSVDKKAFIKELKKLMDYHNHLDQFTFFKLIHTAYEKVLDSHNKKDHIFYHIHNPDTYAWLNFLRLAPNTNWLMMVREPIQSCESWIRDKFNDNDYNNIAHKIFQMLFEVDNIILRDKHAIGVRLEDLKEYPKKTISALCDWLDIKENDSLYEMTAQGKKWWGDPSSPDYSKEAMSPFGKISTKHKLGSIFSENDQYILSTLFYPFSVRFNYVEENLEKFKNDLQAIRPMLDQMFDFERKIVQNKKMNTESFMQSGSYLYLRSGMIERWNTLNTHHTYPNMLTLLKIN
jgi:Flp pilus assembly protein TadD